MYRLLFINGNLKGKRLTIQQGNLLIGRGEECHVRLEDDERVAEHHAIIEYRKSGPVIRLLDPARGLEVNQAPVSEHPLRHGDSIGVGGTIMEFHAARAKAPPRQHRRFSKMQAVSILAITLVVLLQLGFVIIFPLWQKTETVDAPFLPEPEEEESLVSENPPAPPPAVPDVASVKPSVTDVIAPPILAPPVEKVPAPPPEPEKIAEPLDLLKPQAVSLVKDALQQIKQKNYMDADNMLHRAQLLSPDYLPAWRERAKLFEERQMFREAAGQWSSIAEIAVDAAGKDDARAQVDRLRGLEQAEASTEAPERGISEEVEGGEKKIRILSVERGKFNQTEEYQEMRVLRISLRPRAEEGDIVSSRVRVEVEFFDQVKSSMRVVPTRANVVKDGLVVQGDWPAGEARTLTAAYVVPHGFREKEFSQSGEHREFHGYRVSLYYRNKLQERYAKPNRLMDY